ncbi:hypothetical protein HG537_0F02050 [Torulaspora globosa]|uniref:Methyltransferase type 12 domain-containing protein n=1 Tax=Torulaspora globosa TaxID=48254 RepID=A0A7H9HUN1_9SACH|nr:hypothetical protein HG537_0F02050 [Torulaspora sp. CBS 2947]
MGVADLIKKFEKISASDEKPIVAETVQESRSLNDTEKKTVSQIETQEDESVDSRSKKEDEESDLGEVDETGKPTENELAEEDAPVGDHEAEIENCDVKKSTAEAVQKPDAEGQEDETTSGDDKEKDESANETGEIADLAVEGSNDAVQNQSESSKKKKKKNKKKKKKNNSAVQAEEPINEDGADESSLGKTNTHDKEELQAVILDVQEEVSETMAHDKTPVSEETENSTTRLGRDDPFEFGKRTLTENVDVWDHNAWDNVEWGEEQIKSAEEKIKAQYDHPVSEFDKKLYNGNPARYWDIFYKNNKENFFKDRKWLQIEFPCLYAATKKDAGPVTIFEIGCGAGNTFFPILNENENEHLRVIAADFAPKAVELVKNSENFNPKYGHAAVWDLANPEGDLPDGVEPHSVDIAVMIFVFSALAPDQWEQALANLHKVMKPGGKILFRDYGRYDLAQVRFKKNRLLEDNFYIRGDGTRVYFFTEEELREIFTNGSFIENRIGTDRRLLVNRKRQLKMYRCWLQAVFEVPN